MPNATSAIVTAAGTNSGNLPRSRKHRWVSSSESQPSPSSPFSRPAPSSIRRSTGPPARQICFYSAACTSSGVRDDVRSPRIHLPSGQLAESGRAPLVARCATGTAAGTPSA